MSTSRFKAAQQHTKAISNDTRLAGKSLTRSGYPRPPSRGLTILQLMSILAVVGIVAWLILNQFAA